MHITSSSTEFNFATRIGFLNVMPQSFSASLIAYQNIIQHLFSKPIETYFSLKVPWKSGVNSMEFLEQNKFQWAFEQHFNNTCGSMVFHDTSAA